MLSFFIVRFKVFIALAALLAICELDNFSLVNQEVAQTERPVIRKVIQFAVKRQAYCTMMIFCTVVSVLLANLKLNR